MTNESRLAVCGFLMLVAASVSAAPLTDADFELARNGDLGAQLQLGIAIVNQTVEADAAIGQQFLELAAGQGSGYAAQQLGYIYASPKILPTDIAIAEQQYELAVAQENPLALRDYGLMLHSGHRFDLNRDRGLALIKRSAQLGDAMAKMYLANVLQESEDPQIQKLATAWRQTMDEDETANAAVALAIEHSRGDFLPVSIGQEEFWMQQANNEQLNLAIGGIAADFASEWNIRRDDFFAAELYESVIAANNPGNTNNYAWLLSTAKPEAVRNGERAIRMMKLSIDEHGSNAIWLDTLAAAYAEVGDFSNAIAVQKDALQTFEDEEPDEVAGATLRLEYYLEGHAWRE